MIEKIFKREDGSQVQLRVRWVNTHSNFVYLSIGYDILIKVRSKGKRKWIDPIDRASWEYRSKPFPNGRKEYEQEQIMKLITPEEIYLAKMELWETIKPEKP